MEAVGEKKAPWWVLVLRILALFAVLFGGSWAVLGLFLGLPNNVAMLFAAVLGVQGCGLGWISAGIRSRVRQNIVEARFESHRLRKRGWIALAFFTAGFAAFVVLVPKGIWLQTFSAVGLLLLGVYGGFSVLASHLIEWESGMLSHGFTGRWLGRLTAFVVACTGFILIMIVNFLGGIHWWYNTYITPEKRQEVSARNRYLKDIKLTTLFDRHNRYIGLYRKTESDWSDHYNDPKLLDWHVSRVISLAEGQVRPPAWWWRYLPDGEKLKCEPFSIEAFLRMPYYMIKQRRRVGGSTPALQAAKNFLDFGGSRRGKGLLTTVRTKLFAEMPRAYIMCQSFSSRDMMAIYQATLWAGKGANYGVHRMALHYFDVDDPSSLSWNQAVVVAASLPNPGRLNPWYVESCRKGACKNKRREAVYKVWKKRIQMIKARMRREGIKVPKELPAFKDGLGKLKAISYRWKNHDVHIRSWIQQRIQKQAPQLKQWESGAQIRLFYDRRLLTGTQQKPGLASIAQKSIEAFRYQLDDLQISFALIDTRNGRLTSLYGGDGSVDMALAKKPVVGSTFKVLTLMVGDQWPDQLPLLNKGREKANRRRFSYHPTPRHKGHWVRNSHAMPAYVLKPEALSISANIGFVFFSLRWTWMTSPLTWIKVFSKGLQQMFMKKYKATKEQAKEAVEELMRDPVKLRRKLVRDFGYKPYFANLREQATFEAAKAATIKTLLSDAEVDKKHLTDLLALEASDSMESLSQKIKDTFAKEKEAVAKRFQGTMSLEELSWARELRMEMGLRYIISLAKEVAGYDPKENHLLPVMTMTLGVNDADTVQLASVPALVTSKTLRRPKLLMTIGREKEVHYSGQAQMLERLSVSQEALKQVHAAMQQVLKKGGTAASAGAFLKKKYGDAIMAQAGAKTGTVQSTRGVSCIGFLEHRAGAVTLSTPKNEKLKAYRVRRSLTNKLALYERRTKYWYKRFERARSGSRWGRRALQKALKYKRIAKRWRTKIANVREQGKGYIKLLKQRKQYMKLYSGLRKRALRGLRRARLYKRRLRLYKRRMERSQRRIDRDKQRIEDLGGIKDMSAKEKRRFRYYTKRIKRFGKQVARWKAKALTAEKKAKTYEKQAGLDSRKAQGWKDKASDIRSASAKMRRAFLKTHQPWSLSSAAACRVLFRLLSHWKEWEKTEPPPKEEPIPELTKPSQVGLSATNADGGSLPAPPVIAAASGEPVSSEPVTSTDAGAPVAPVAPDASSADRPTLAPDHKQKAPTAPDVASADKKADKVNQGLKSVLKALEKPGKVLIPGRVLKKKKKPSLPAPPRIIGED